MTDRTMESWRRPGGAASLTDLQRSVAVPSHGFLRKLLAFGGPGYLISVGYMDPGNWATDLGEEPQRHRDRPRVGIAAGARQIAPGRDAESHAQRLQQHGHQA